MVSNQLDGLSTTRTFWLILGLISVCIVGYTDYVTGAEISFALFYWVPIALVTWFAGATLGAVIATISTIVWMTPDHSMGVRYSSPLSLYWNTLIRYTFFLITVVFLDQKQTLDRERSFARSGGS